MRHTRLAWLWFCIGLLICPLAGSPWAAAQAPSVAPQLAALRDVGREGQGNAAATRAWAELAARSDVDDLPTILAAIDGASPLAANWLRAAVDTVAERHLRRDGKLSTAGLEKFLHDKSHEGRARRTAYEWIARADATAPDRLIPQMLDDPSLELRRDAVARLLKQAEGLSAEKPADALAVYRQALVAARDLDQIKIITDALAKQGQLVDLAHHFGFLQDWKLVGPFDNHGGKGFAAVYPPETAVDVNAEYPTAAGTIRWLTHHTRDEYGYVDLNQAIGKHMGAVAYVAAEFLSDKRQPVELRLGTQNANKIWLNGKLLFTTEVYHANGTMDQYVGRGELQPGKNMILLKICQNEQTQEWAQDWKYQVRACDASGKAILSTDRPAPRVGPEQTAANSTKE